MLFRLIPDRPDHERTHRRILSIIATVHSVLLFGSVLDGADIRLVVSGTDPLLSTVLGFQIQTTHFNHAPHQADSRCLGKTKCQIVHSTRDVSQPPGRPSSLCVAGIAGNTSSLNPSSSPASSRANVLRGCIARVLRFAELASRRSKALFTHCSDCTRMQKRMFTPARSYTAQGLPCREHSLYALQRLICLFWSSSALHDTLLL